MATAVIEQPKIESEPKPWSSLMEKRHRITVEEYHRMLDSGVLGPEPKVELLEGVIVEKMTKKPPHVHATDLLEDLLHHLLPRGCGYFVSMGNPVTIEDRDGEPEPDAAVFRGSTRDFGDRPHTPAEAALLAEVAHTSYDYDRYAKWVTYAAARVPVYWIVDLNRRRLEVHTEPTGEGEAAIYTRTQILGPDDEVALVLDGREIGRFPVKEILP
jgi:Uma2 family endonuclease